MRIGIDLDEVLADFNSGLIKWHNEKYGTSLKRENFISYFFNQVWGGTIEETIIKVNDFHHSEYFEKLSPVEASVEAIPILSRENDLFIITSRPDFLENETERWVNYFFEKQFKEIFHSSNHYSQATNSGKTKLQICRDLGVSVLIDDSLNYISQCASTEVNGLLFGNYPWNQNGHLPSNIFRTNNWKEVLEKL